MAVPACRAVCAEVMTPVNLENHVGGKVLGGTKGHRIKGSGRQNDGQAKADCE
jgi:hypothetical protein